MESNIYDEADSLVEDLLNDNESSPTKEDKQLSNGMMTFIHYIDTVDALSIKNCSEFINKHTDLQFDHRLKQYHFIFDFCFSDPGYLKTNIDIKGRCFVNWFVSIYNNLSRINPKIFSILFRGIWDMDLYHIVRSDAIQQLGITTIIKSDIIYTGNTTKTVDLVEEIFAKKPKNILIA